MEEAPIAKAYTKSPKETKTIIQEDKIYLLSIDIEGESMIISIPDKDRFDSIYLTIITLSELEKINRVFRMFESIYEVKKFFFDQIERKELKITKREDTLKLEIKVVAINKNETVMISLHKEKKKKKIQ